MREFVLCWLHHCTYRREKQVQTDNEFITSTEKTLCQVHLVSEHVRGDLQLCSHTRESRANNLTPTRDGIPLTHRAVQGENESLSRLSESENDTRLILEEKTDHLIYSQRQNRKYRNKNAEQIFSTVLFVNFEDKFIPAVWRLTILTLDMKHLEGSRPGFTKNWHSEKEHFEKLILEVYTRWKNWKRAQEMGIDEFSG